LGIDLVLITQHPSLIDPAVRRLSGSHRHLVRIWGMEASTVHQWPSVKDNCDKSRGDSEKTKWAFDKSVYKLYKSAEVHTMKRSIPGRVKLLGVLVLLFAAAVWYMVGYVKKRTQPPPAAVATASSTPASGQSVSNNTNTTQTNSARPLDPLADAIQYAARETPRVAGLPHTAPKYDELTKPVRVPVPAMCIEKGSLESASGLACKCYTQQGTPMAVDMGMCRTIAHNGYFQDFDAEPKRAELARADATQVGSKERSEDKDAGPHVLVIPELPDRPVTTVRVSGYQPKA
jgi:zona occludens toxin